MDGAGTLHGYVYTSPGLGVEVDWNMTWICVYLTGNGSGVDGAGTLHRYVHT